MTRHRCFVSLDLPDALQEAAKQAQRALRPQAPQLRYTAPENLHLTLKFLGEISPEQVLVVRERLRAVESAPFSVALNGAGVFSPRIVWLAVSGADALQQKIDAALEGVFTPERRFMGHVTIARTKRIPESLSATLDRLDMSNSAALVRSFSLQESHLSHLGPTYETLERYAL